MIHLAAELECRPQIRVRVKLRVSLELGLGLGLGLGLESVPPGLREHEINKFC